MVISLVALVTTAALNLIWAGIERVFFSFFFILGVVDMVIDYWLIDWFVGVVDFRWMILSWMNFINLWKLLYSRSIYICENITKLSMRNKSNWVVMGIKKKININLSINNYFPQDWNILPRRRLHKIQNSSVLKILDIFHIPVTAVSIVSGSCFFIEKMWN